MKRFPWEKNLDNVKSASSKLGVAYPVAIDNGFETWKRYGTRYWPTIHLIDKKGIVRYTRFGEGGYAEMESIIGRLLKER